MTNKHIPASYGSTIKGQTLQRSTLGEILTTIKSDPDLAIKIGALRALSTKSEIDAAKAALPYFNLGVFKGDHRKADALEHTEFMIIDFDKVDRLEDLKARVQSDPDVFFSFVSPSGNGLKVAYRFDKAITDPNEFTSIYKYYLDVLFGRYGVEPDKSTKDASRACFFSSDPELYCNPDAKLLPTSVAGHQPSINLAAVGALVKDEDAALVPAAIEHLRKYKLGYQDWFRCGLALATLGEDGRAHFRDLSINDHYRDSEAEINTKYDECLRNASGSIQLSTLFHIAKGHGFSHAAPVVTPGRFEDFAHELSDQFALADTRDPNLLLGLELQTFSELAKKIDGLQPGFYHLAAETNVGKTAFLTNLALDILTSDAKAIVLYFSLDDNRSYTVNRMLSAQSALPINDVQRPRDLPPADKALLGSARDRLLRYVTDQRLLVLDISQVQHIDDVEEHIKGFDDRSKLVVLIDGLYNLQVRDESGNIRVENIERAQKIKKLVDTYRIALVSTGELRKKTKDESDSKKPSLHDLMETGKFAYNANVVWLLHAESPAEASDLSVALTLSFAKNKLSDFKGDLRLRFERNKGRMREWHLGQAQSTKQTPSVPGAEDMFSHEHENR